jgi:hypothetical protein
MPASDAGSRPAAPSPYLVASAAISAGDGGAGDDAQEYLAGESHN